MQDARESQVLALLLMPRTHITDLSEPGGAQNPSPPKTDTSTHLGSLASQSS